MNIYLAYFIQKWFNTLLDDCIKRRRDYDARIQIRWYWPTVADCIFNFARDFLAYAILIKRVLDGQMDVATFTLYLGLIASFSNWIYSLASNFSEIKKGIKKAHYMM